MSQGATIAVPGLAVTFDRRGDRYGHTICLRAGDRAVDVLHSVEGNADEPWPPSPPLQALQCEARLGGISVALLVGMAGKSHWSLSCQAEPEGSGIAFDVACRVSGKPPHLGSVYRLAEDATFDAAIGAIKVPGVPTPCRIAAAASAVGDRLTQLLRGRELVLGISGTGLTPRQTVRWKYIVSR